MEISISEAAKSLKIGRSTIYKKLSEGELSKTPSGKIDTSELFRVFGNSPKTPTKDDLKSVIDSQTRQKDSTETAPNLSARLAQLEAENIQLRERLTEARETIQEAREREAWQRGQIEKLTDTVRMIEAPKTAPTPPAPAPKPRTFFDRLFGG